MDTEVDNISETAAGGSIVHCRNGIRLQCRYERSYFDVHANATVDMQNDSSLGTERSWPAPLYKTED